MPLPTRDPRFGVAMFHATDNKTQGAAEVIVSGFSSCGGLRPRKFLAGLCADHFEFCLQPADFCIQFTETHAGCSDQSLGLGGAVALTPARLDTNVSDLTFGFRFTVEKDEIQVGGFHARIIGQSL